MTLAPLLKSSWPGLTHGCPSLSQDPCQRRWIRGSSPRMTIWLWRTAPNSNRLSRIRHRGGEAAVDRDRLSVDIGRIVAGEKKSHCRELMRLAGALERVELADLVVGAALLGIVEDRLGHAGFDQAGTHRVDAHAGA